ncbi:glycine-rich domain-containing protein [Massilia horti]|uniref:Glycine-rich domain-containing protein-like n=1 Tax=Massilia horti TaxID=2562153 RepID=A0A4Y9T2J1_9BURK|nr:glycine-rich domain-containing protein-like [Massilia horti]TFW31818.1 glycine-rich domain-containing protein-like [Massilia horti]
MLSSEDSLAINALDFEAIKEKLMDRKAGKGWPRTRAESAEREYRRFLYLVKKFPDTPLAPDADVDKFWHYHILDTKKYAADCQRIFGYFLHHFPYAGMRGEEDEAAMKRIGTSTAALYERTFGEDYSSATSGGKRTAFSTAVRLSSAYTPSAAAPADGNTSGGSHAAYCWAQGRQAAYCWTPARQTAYCWTQGSEECCVESADCAVVSECRPPEQRIGFYLERPRLPAA